MFSIIPDPTPLELADAERQIELAKVTFDKAQADLDRSGALKRSGLIPLGDFDAQKETFDHARIQLEMTKERYSLLKEGKIKRTEGKSVDSVIRAPASRSWKS